jgi:two-component system, NtrC family, sensor kinase
VATELDPAAVRPTDAADLPNEALEEINRLWTIVRAFSNAAHDVNNDLQVIAGNAELLEGRDLDPVMRRRVQAIREQAVAAAATVNRLLAYSRSEPATPGPVDLSEVVKTAVAMRRSSLNRARVSIASEPGPEPCWALADGSRTLQALIDLLLAAEEIVKGGPKARILLRVGRETDVVEVLVTGDAGAAMTGSTPASSRAAAMASGTQLWAAAHLAVSQGGSLNIVDSEAGRTWALRLPAFKPRE